MVLPQTVTFEIEHLGQLESYICVCTVVLTAILVKFIKKETLPKLQEFTLHCGKNYPIFLNVEDLKLHLIVGGHPLLKV